MMNLDNRNIEAIESGICEIIENRSITEKNNRMTTLASQIEFGASSSRLGWSPGNKPEAQKPDSPSDFGQCLYRIVIEVSYSGCKPNARQKTWSYPGKEIHCEYSQSSHRFVICVRFFYIGVEPSLFRGSIRRGTGSVR